MTETWVDIRHKEVADRPLFGGHMGLREAVQNYVRLRWPANTAKMAAKEWDLTLDEAKGLAFGRTSIATLDKILHHRRGGWKVGLQLLGAVIGYAVQAFFIAERERLADEAEHARRAAEAAAEVEGRAIRSFAPAVARGLSGLGIRLAPVSLRPALSGEPLASDLGSEDPQQVAAPRRGGGR